MVRRIIGDARNLRHGLPQMSAPRAIQPIENAFKWRIE